MMKTNKRRSIRFARSRRRGFVLLMALLVILLGVALTLGIFALSRSVYNLDITARSDYDDYIDVTSVIEEAKGFIVAENNRRSEDVEGARVVLHGKGGGDGKDYFKINSLEDLQVCTPATVVHILSRDIPISPEGRPTSYGSSPERFMRLQVFDANYRAEDVKFTPAPGLAGFPPSAMPPGGYSLSTLEQEGTSGASHGEEYTKGGRGGADPGEEPKFNVYEDFGAYLIRVDIFRAGREAPIRRIEEMFYMRIPPNPPAQLGSE